MNARIVPFPSVCRPHELSSIVQRVAEAPNGKEQDKLVSVLVPIARRMQRAQVSEAEIRRDLAALEALVWGRIDYLNRRQGGVT